MLKLNQIYNEDCLGERGMCLIPDKSVDMILTDLPYEVTQNFWDSMLPLEELWSEYKRVIKPNGAIVLTAQQPFTTDLIVSNRKDFRYSLVWNKMASTGFLNANVMPLREHEDILVFYKSPPTYNPQKTRGNKNHSKRIVDRKQTTNYGKYAEVDNSEILGEWKYPTSIISIPKVHPSKCLHPNEKPVPLMESLIRTYTNEGDMVLDNCMGSGTTAVACIATRRNFIGFELDPEYHRIATERIANVQAALFV